ncbi:M57 family metalloprotease [Aquimarina sp. 2201CG1-2-11]|uniref:M57 family metalloprotease n=1 Tax=Aquimarina discodermiae TaxID=3231043 RepID=UPI0034618F7F
MKNFKCRLGILVAISVVLLTSCEKEQLDPVDDNNSQEISSKILDKLESISLNPTSVERKTYEDIDGTEKTMLIVSDDIAISEEQLWRMDVGDGVQSKQYHTTNLVSTPRTVRVVGYNGNNRFGLSTVAQRALRYAVNNYNALNTSIQFSIVFTTNFNSNDIVAYTQTSGSVIAQDGVRGRAGFPSGGEPFKRIIINGGANNFNNDQILEGLFTHEIGHCFGLRHTDWNTRNSCGQSGESQFPEGAIRIPGTPGASQDPSSIMNACLSSSDGEFGQFDRVALEYLY